MRGGARRPKVLAASAGLALVLAFAILAGAGGSAALARAAESRHQKLIDGTVRFLEEHQLESGAYADSGTKPTQSISAWVTLALAAAGVDPLDQTRTVGGVACGHSAQEYLEAHFAESFHEETARTEFATTAFERELLVVDTSGTDPHDFAGYDLVAEIIARQQPDGGIPFVPGGKAQVNDAVFAIVALAPVKEPAAEEAVRKAEEWLLTAADPDGGFNWEGPEAPTEVDLTGAAIEALVAAGDKGTEVEADALSFLRTAQRPDGGFAEYPSTEGESNVASTAWGVQGIWASGGDPETWRTGSGLATEEPLDYMESLQQPDGHVRWKASRDVNGIWMTAYVLPAFAGQVLPYPPVVRAEGATERLPSCGEATTAPKAPPGPEEGSGPADPEEGVGAGGGGEGARDFSRPQPGSKGKTPGGARITRHADDEKARDHARTRRGANLHQATGSETEEPRRGSEADQEVEGVSAGANPAAGGEEATGGGEPEGAAASDPAAAGRHNHGHPGDHGAPISTAGAKHANDTATGEEVSGVVIGSPGGRRGKLAFGAPGLRSAGRGGGEEPWVPLAIAGGALALLALGARRELRGRGWRRVA
jgi:Prenyltransferase and squalene oxidase repeat